MTLLWRSTPEIFWAELFKCLQHKRVGGYTRLPFPPLRSSTRSIPTRACRLYEFYRDLSSVKYAVPISFVFANELSDRRIANARKLAGKFDTLSLSVSLIDWIFKIKGEGGRGKMNPSPTRLTLDERIFL